MPAFDSPGLPPATLSHDQRSALLALATVQRLRPRTPIITPGLVLDRLWHVVSGEALVRAHRPSGRRPGRPLARIPAGCFFGETGVFVAEPHVAQSWVQTGPHGGRFAWWPLGLVRERVLIDPVLAGPLLFCLGAQMALRIQALLREVPAGERPAARVAAALAAAARRDGRRQDGQLILRIDATALAAAARCSPVTVRRLLVAWRAQGRIGGHGRYHLLDERFFLWHPTGTTNEPARGSLLLSGGTAAAGMACSAPTSIPPPASCT